MRTEEGRGREGGGGNEHMTQLLHRCISRFGAGTRKRGTSSNMMALITSDCGI